MDDPEDYNVDEINPKCLMLSWFGAAFNPNLRLLDHINSQQSWLPEKLAVIAPSAAHNQFMKMERVRGMTAGVGSDNPARAAFLTLALISVLFGPRYSKATGSAALNVNERTLNCHVEIPLVEITNSEIRLILHYNSYSGGISSFGKKWSFMPRVYSKAMGLAVLESDEFESLYSISPTPDEERSRKILQVIEATKQVDMLTGGSSSIVFYDDLEARLLNDPDSLDRQLTQLFEGVGAPPGEYHSIDGRHGTLTKFADGRYLRHATTEQDFDKLGQLTSERFEHEAAIRCTYEDKLLAKIADEMGNSLRFHFDTTNKLVTSVTASSSGRSVYFKYDDVGCLREVVDGIRSFKFDYDHIGNMTNCIMNGSYVAMTYNDQYEIVTKKTEHDSTKYNRSFIDAEGNLSTDQRYSKVVIEHFDSEGLVSRTIKSYEFNKLVSQQRFYLCPEKSSEGGRI